MMVDALDVPSADMPFAAVKGPVNTVHASLLIHAWLRPLHCEQAVLFAARDWIENGPSVLGSHAWQAQHFHITTHAVTAPALT